MAWLSSIKHQVAIPWDTLWPSLAWPAAERQGLSWRALSRPTKEERRTRRGQGGKRKGGAPPSLTGLAGHDRPVALSLALRTLLQAPAFSTGQALRAPGYRGKGLPRFQGSSPRRPPACSKPALAASPAPSNFLSLFSPCVSNPRAFCFLSLLNIPTFTNKSFHCPPRAPSLLATPPCTLTTTTTTTYDRDTKPHTTRDGFIQS